MKYLRIFKVLFLLGLKNSLYAIFYKLTLKFKIRKFISPITKVISSKDDFFKIYKQISFVTDQPNEIIEAGNRILNNEFLFFNNKYVKFNNPPDWYLNPFGGRYEGGCTRHWSEVKDFDDSLGDIKGVWELSRFDWMLALSKSYALTNNTIYLDRLNFLVKDWIDKNPAGLGINWKCGQEASIRCFNVINSWLILQKPQVGESLKSFLKAHGERIESNIGYALCQDNNHGTSEASGLYIIGLVLGDKDLSNKGRYYLEKTVKKLILNDGSFSQNSINYHRLMLDTLSFVEVIRNEFSDNGFSSEYYDKINRATNWLFQFVASESGDAPNLGANDGAQLFNNKPQTYRDYKSSVSCAIESFKFSDNNFTNEDQYFKEGGYGILRNNNADLFLRAPVYKFRPTQSDQMHIDLWIEGIPYLIDSGTFSYNDKTGIGDLLKSSKSHNTIVFDDMDPMPVLGKFLYGEWLRGEFNKTNSGFFCKYKDYRGYSHERIVEKISNGFKVVDKISGNYNNAKLYWHLAPNKWDKIKNSVSCQNVTIEVISENEITMDLVTVKKSLHYLDLIDSCCLVANLNSSVNTIETLVTIK